MNKMKIGNGKLNFFLVVLCLTIVIGFNQCDAGKDKDKHKHKQKHEPDNHKNANNNQQQQHQHQKNSTAHHHQNDTSVHDSAAAAPHPDNNPLPIGWSMHSNPNQPHPPANPHGYAVQQPHPLHPDQPHPAPQQPHSPQGQPAPNQDSGSSALASGVGGFALGALGGAAGGYLLSNALNSDDKAEEKATEAELITETTLPSLPVSVVQETTVAASSDAVPSSIAETSPVVVETTPPALIVTSENVPAETVTSFTAETKAEVLKSEQKLADNVLAATETPKDNNGLVNKLSLIVFIMSVTSSYVLSVRF